MTHPVLLQAVLPAVQHNLAQHALDFGEERGRGALGLLALLGFGVGLGGALFLERLLRARARLAGDRVDEVERDELVGGERLLVRAEEGRDEVRVRLRAVAVGEQRRRGAERGRGMRQSAADDGQATGTRTEMLASARSTTDWTTVGESLPLVTTALTSLSKSCIAHRSVSITWAACPSVS